MQPRCPVQGKGLRTEQSGQLSGRATSLEVHLEKAILRMRIAQSEGDRLAVLRIDAQ